VELSVVWRKDNRSPLLLKFIHEFIEHRLD